MTSKEILIVNYLLEQIVLDYQMCIIPETYLEKFAARQQEQIMREAKTNLIKLGISKAELKKYNYWNLPDTERVDLIRRKLLKEHNIEIIEQ